MPAGNPAVELFRRCVTSEMVSPGCTDVYVTNASTFYAGNWRFTNYLIHLHHRKPIFVYYAVNNFRFCLFCLP